MKLKVFHLSLLVRNFLMVQYAVCEEGSTIKTDVATVVDVPKNPDTFYREIVQQAIELMWSQEGHLVQMKIRESRIRRKSKQSAIEMQDIIVDTDELFKSEIDILSDRFWTPKPDQKYKIPITSEVVQHFMKNWKKFEDLVDTDLKMRPNVETDCNEIKDEMRKAQTNLNASFEEIQEQMKILQEVRDREKKAKKPKGYVRGQAPQI